MKGDMPWLAYKRDNIVDIIMTATIKKYALVVEADESEVGAEEELDEGNDEGDVTEEGDVTDEEDLTEEGDADDEYEEEYEGKDDEDSGIGPPSVTLTPKKPSSITPSSAPVTKI